MARKRYAAEEIIGQVRTIEIELGKELVVDDAYRKLGITPLEIYILSRIYLWPSFFDFGAVTTRSRLAHSAAFRAIKQTFPPRRSGTDGPLWSWRSRPAR